VKTGNKERIMDRKGLISLLQRSAGAYEERTRFCPDDHEIAGFIDGSLDDIAREHVERHLPDCQGCVSRVGLLARLLRDQAANNQAEVTESNTRDWKQTAPQWAVAASVILAVGYLAATFNFAENTDPAAEYQTTRNLDSQITAPVILAPTSDVIGKRDELVIRWTEVPGTLFYEVRVVSDVGNLVSSQRVNGTEWAIGRDLSLESGREYFVRVDAFLTDAKPISSHFIPFRLRE
jgi:hypothetical protein